MLLLMQVAETIYWLGRVVQDLPGYCGPVLELDLSFPGDLEPAGKVGGAGWGEVVVEHCWKGGWGWVGEVVMEHCWKGGWGCVGRGSGRALLEIWLGLGGAR